MPKIIQQTVTFSAPPDKLYDLYMNQKLHAAITRQSGMSQTPVFFSSPSKWISTPYENEKGQRHSLTVY